MSQSSTDSNFKIQQKEKRVSNREMQDEQRGYGV